MRRLMRARLRLRASAWQAASVLLIALSFSAVAFAQGGGASSTGTIQGRVMDAQGAV